MRAGLGAQNRGDVQVLPEVVLDEVVSAELSMQAAIDVALGEHFDASDGYFLPEPG